MSKKTMKPISLAIGTAFVTTLAAGNVSAATDANENPFAMNDLSSGYMQLASGYGDAKSDKEGKCGEGKCGEDKDKGDKEGKCGEGKCGGKGEMKKNMKVSVVEIKPSRKVSAAKVNAVVTSNFRII